MYFNDKNKQVVFIYKAGFALPEFCYFFIVYVCFSLLRPGKVNFLD